MMKKILTFSVVLAMALVMLSGPAAGYGDTLQGYNLDSYDGVNLSDGTNIYGNVTVVHVQDAGDIPVQGTDSNAFSYDSGNAATGYSWSATGVTEAAWIDAPTTAGDDLYFIKEVGGYYSATHAAVTETTSIKANMGDMYDQLEPIPTPTATSVGTDYIELSIPAPKYTDASLSAGGTTGQGTFEAVTSYAVFYSDDSGATWSFAGNATNFVAGGSPIVPVVENPDPSTVDTGHYTFNTSTDGGLTLSPGTDYEFKIRVNIGPTGALGGYGGGLGSYTTWGAGSSTGPIQTQPLSEFGVGLIVPVVATIGLFATFTVYRKRKKE